MGTKFLKERIKLPEYLSVRGSITLEKLKSRLSSPTYDFIFLDIEEFVACFKPKVSRPISLSSCKFMKLLDIFSKMKISDLVSWGIYPLKDGSDMLVECNLHSHTVRISLAPISSE